jgi:hypothetical protein
MDLAAGRMQQFGMTYQLVGMEGGVAMRAIVKWRMLATIEGGVQGQVRRVDLPPHRLRFIQPLSAPTAPTAAAAAAAAGARRCQASCGR